MPTICHACGKTSPKCAEPIAPPTDCRRVKIANALLTVDGVDAGDLTDKTFECAEAVLAAFETPSTGS